MNHALETHLEAIGPKLDAIERRLAERKISVMVLGPQRPKPWHKKEAKRLYAKREQIRDVLNTIPGVAAYFPEQKEYAAPFRAQFRGGASNPRELERLMAEAADVIVALEPGSGVQQEVAYFGSVRALQPKILDLLPVAYRCTSTTSYAGLTRRRLSLHYYTKAELNRCDVATVVCPNHVIEERVRLVLG